jgi:Xaa-Pro aminopeptidase
MTAPRLAALRAALAMQGIEGFIVPRADEHLGEYVPPGAERLTWLTGFTGSAGIAIVLANEAAAFTDGRYVLQMAQQTDAASFQLLHIVNQPPVEWAAARTKRLGYDPWLMSQEAVLRYGAAGIEMVPLSPNPIDALWDGRPSPPSAPAVPHPLEFAGQASAEKRAQVAQSIETAAQQACVLTDPASVAWLLNLRGGDLPFTPVALAFAIVHVDARTDLFIDPAKLSAETRAWLDADVTCHPYEAFATALAGFAGKAVRVDPAGSPAAIGQLIRASGGEPVDGTDPCLLPKACKNATEQDGARAAHRRDAIAVCRFLRWLETAVGETEWSAAARLVAFREDVAGFRGESFPAISGAGEHGAVIHYRVTPDSDRPIQPDEVYLIDSGGQFEDGTTDITRTVWTGPGTPSPELRARFTAVLRGNIALARTVFPHGVAGAHLDAVARRPLWALGLDYDHGTGHGVGNYLSVHEGPVSLSRAARNVPIEAGMILSNEPGYYQPGAYGIRLETLLLVQPAQLPAANKPFLCFEVLTLAPFDRRLIEPALLEAAELAWLDAYHARVASELSGKLGTEFDVWLASACRPLEPANSIE